MAKETYSYGKRGQISVKRGLLIWQKRPNITGVLTSSATSPWLSVPMYLPCTHMRARARTHTHTHTHTHMCVCVFCLRVCVCVSVTVSLCVSLCLSVSISGMLITIGLFCHINRSLLPHEKVSFDTYAHLSKADSERTLRQRAQIFGRQYRMHQRRRGGVIYFLQRKLFFTMQIFRRQYRMHQRRRAGVIYFLFYFIFMFFCTTPAPTCRGLLLFYS